MCSNSTDRYNEEKKKKEKKSGLHGVMVKQLCVKFPLILPFSSYCLSLVYGRCYFSFLFVFLCCHCKVVQGGIHEYILHRNYMNIILIFLPIELFMKSNFWNYAVSALIICRDTDSPDIHLLTQHIHFGLK